MHEKKCLDKWRWWLADVLLILLAIYLMACRSQQLPMRDDPIAFVTPNEASPALATPTLQQIRILPATEEEQPISISPISTIASVMPNVSRLTPFSESPQDDRSPTATRLLSPTPTLTPYDQFTIDSLVNRGYGGGTIKIIDTIAITESFTRYLISYPSDGLTIHGFMDVPTNGTAFPIAIVLHGYIPPEEYQTLTYTTRYADALAQAGYFVIHPNMRGFPPSDDGEDPFRTGLAIDVLNLIAIIREQSQDPLGYLRRADADNIHIWGHSMGGGVALRVITVNNEPYIRAAVLYGSMSGDERLNYEQIKVWSDGRVGDFELNAAEDVMHAISPINHLERISAAVSIHHSKDDQTVPVSWSEQLCSAFEVANHPAECFFYDGLPHTFTGAGDKLFIDRVIDFYHHN